MSAIYDNWERLVAAVLKKEQLWQLFHDHSRSPSILSEASDFSSSFSLGSPLHDLASELSSFGSSSRLWRAPPKLVVISDFSPAFDVSYIRLASAQLLGRGTFGTVYTVVMDKKVKFVVKRLNSMSISEQDFKRHMDIVGKVRHKNVAALRAYSSSENERLMLYDYYSKGSVYALLHGRVGESQAHVDWETRVKIAIGAARGIAEIHTQNGGQLVHGNIKSSNIFVNRQKYGCVSDLGLANMIETTFMRTALCYAPEIKSTRDISQESDVYGFGIVLLELLTRKSTMHLPGGPEVVDLVKLVGSVESKEGAAKVFDEDLLKHPTIREEMVKMLEIGIKCIAKSIKKRPKMSEVVKMLEDIIRMNPESLGPSAMELVFMDDPNPTFDLEHTLRATGGMLGRGTFGSCYKAILENGNAIVVKKLKDVILTYDDFQQHMEVIGRMNHENVAELRAFHFSSNDKYLVYDYYNKDSLSALLHGNDKYVMYDYYIQYSLSTLLLEKTVTNWVPLDWETRLKIAVGAARGIAHIHRQDGGRLVHGNIKSSNIFVNAKKYGIVSDVGLAKLISPIGLFDMPAPGYCAPEVTDTGKVSQASDVYSFGLVLFELISGNPSQYTPSVCKVISLVKWIKSLPRDEWITEVFDVELLGNLNDEEAMVQLLQVAMDCVAIVPNRRPTMPEILKILEEISGIGPLNISSLEDQLDDKWGQRSLESRLEDILEGLLPTLTP